MLDIKGLTVKVLDKVILNDLNLSIKPGEVHVIMGRNGTGKSTLCKSILKYPGYEITDGSIWFNGKNMADMTTTEIAREGIFLLNQSPIAVEGVTNAEMLRMALSEIKDEHINIFEFNKKMENICQKLDLPLGFIHREINVGMSGGERKKNELLHMWMLEPKFIMLDELDSGLDIDALKIVAKSINEYHKEYNCGILIITHHDQLLEMIDVDYVHIVKNGSIVKSGDKSLAKQIEKEGFKAFIMSGNE